MITNIKTIILVLAFILLKSIDCSAQNNDSYNGAGLHFDAFVGPRINKGSLRQIDRWSFDCGFDLRGYFRHLNLLLGYTSSIGILNTGLEDPDEYIRLFDGDKYKIQSFDMAFGYRVNFYQEKWYFLPAIGGSVGFLKFRGDMQRTDDGDWVEIVPPCLDDFRISTKFRPMFSAEIGRQFIDSYDSGCISINIGLRYSVRTLRIQEVNSTFNGRGQSICAVIGMGFNVKK